jgi:hypothetical protein
MVERSMTRPTSPVPGYGDENRAPYEHGRGSLWERVEGVVRALDMQFGRWRQGKRSSDARGAQQWSKLQESRPLHSIHCFQLMTVDYTFQLLANIFLETGNCIQLLDSCIFLMIEISCV